MNISETPDRCVIIKIEDDNIFYKKAVKVSLKEEKIQNARKEWLKVRNEADKLLTIYKEEKSDFYKKGLVVK